MLQYKARKTPSELSIRGLKESPNIKSIAIALDCFLEVEGKTLFLKSPHTSDFEFKGIKLDLIWKTSFLGRTHSTGGTYANCQVNSLLNYNGCKPV